MLLLCWAFLLIIGNTSCHCHVVKIICFKHTNYTQSTQLHEIIGQIYRCQEESKASPSAKNQCMKGKVMIVTKLNLLDNVQQLGKVQLLLLYVFVLLFLLSLNIIYFHSSGFHVNLNLDLNLNLIDTTYHPALLLHLYCVIVTHCYMI